MNKTTRFFLLVFVSAAGSFGILSPTAMLAESVVIPDGYERWEKKWRKVSDEVSCTHLGMSPIPGVRPEVLEDWLSLIESNLPGILTQLREEFRDLDLPPNKIIRLGSVKVLDLIEKIDTVDSLYYKLLLLLLQNGLLLTEEEVGSARVELPVIQDISIEYQGGPFAGERFEYSFHTPGNTAIDELD